MPAFLLVSGIDIWFFNIALGKRQTGTRREREGYNIQQSSPAGPEPAMVVTVWPCGMCCNHLASKVLLSTFSNPQFDFLANYPASASLFLLSVSQSSFLLIITWHLSICVTTYVSVGVNLPYGSVLFFCIMWATFISYCINTLSFRIIFLSWTYFQRACWK